MSIEFQKISEGTKPEYVSQACGLMNGQVQQDGRLSSGDFIDFVDATDPGIEAFALIDDTRGVLSVMSIDNSRAPLPKKDVYELVILAVQPEYQKQGLGRYMLRQAERRIAARGGGVLHIGSTTDSYSFYTKAGYTPSNNDDENYVERHIEAAAAPVMPSMPAVQSPREIFANGSYAERVGLGAAIASHALGDLLMAQVFLTDTRYTMGGILDGSESGFTAELSDILAAANESMDNVHSALSQGVRLLDEYRTQLTEG